MNSPLGVSYPLCRRRVFLWWLYAQFDAISTDVTAAGAVSVPVMPFGSSAKDAGEPPQPTTLVPRLTSPDSRSKAFAAIHSPRSTTRVPQPSAHVASSHLLLAPKTLLRAPAAAGIGDHAGCQTRLDAKARNGVRKSLCIQRCSASSMRPSTCIQDVLGSGRPESPTSTACWRHGCGTLYRRGRSPPLHGGQDMRGLQRPTRGQGNRSSASR